MKIEACEIPDVFLITPRIFQDDRGFFYESFRQNVFEEAIGREVSFVQENHSVSQKNVLRGMHYQLNPHAQGKLVRCVQGAVLDVAVDIRKNSAYFGKYVGLILAAENHQQLWIPEGFAHAFLTLSETASFVYKTTNYYSPVSERSIIWNDKTVAIDWISLAKQSPLGKDLRLEDILLSIKDAKALSLEQAELFA